MASRFASRLLRSPILPVSLGLLTVQALRPQLKLDSPAPPIPRKSKSSTSQSELFPPTLPHPSGATLTLVGKGIRTVTFLRIKVYDVGLYVDLNAAGLEQGEKSAGDRMKGLLEGSDMMLRIVPARRTNFTHLRDGFIKALQHRVSLLPSAPPESTQLALGKVMTLFPNTPMTTSQTLDISYFHPGRTETQQGAKEWKSEDGSRAAAWSWRSSKTEGWPAAWLLVGCDGREMGRITDDWVAKEWFAAYFDTTREISKELREGVEKRLNELAKEAPAPVAGKPVKLNWES
ncbi:hypothetical protein CALCODRAFT_491324 [Calocera cornea HHB12733]|uniref:Chalcone isomerase domain-containing protein n=1 Tax=Calocera cornea HHB12733 TaxID=1353952 RepID=A0A165J152_9BASI|nr:hypothetical protein CALCODRAFT_491324 [Calocera cornea HHB12733]